MDLALDSPPILRLPTELLLQILHPLDTQDILNIRQTCRIICKVSYERSIWMNILERQEPYLPIPPDILHAYRHEDRYLHAYSNRTIESIVRNVAHVSSMWHRPRSTLPYTLHRKDVGKTLMGVKLFLDRWLVVVYYEGAVYLYDTKPSQAFLQSAPTGPDEKRNAIPTLRAELFMESGRLCITHVATVDSVGKTLFIVLSLSVPPHTVQIYEVDLLLLASNPHFIPDAFQMTKSISLPVNKVIRAIDPIQRLVALSTSGTVELFNWDEWKTNTDDNALRKIIRVNPGDMDDLWNGIIAVNLLGPYVLIFRTRSLEIHEQPLTSHSYNISGSEPILKHNFPMTYREVSFSQMTTSVNLTSGTKTYETTLFAYDAIQGLFYYVVRVQAPVSCRDELPPTLEVVLTGAYSLAPDLRGPSLYVPLMSEDTPDCLYTMESIPYSASFAPSPASTPTPAFSHTHARAPASSSIARMTRGEQSDDGVRGFLSTHAMGPQGKRGIWVERKRKSTVREIQVWSHNSPPFVSSYKEQLSAHNTAAIEIPRRVVQSLHSYDLREDITCCTFGELSGIIVLGHRSGDVSILEL